jgi:acetyl esterase
MDKKYPLSESMTGFVKESLSFFHSAVVDQGIDAQRLAYDAMTSHFGSSRPIALQVEDQTLAGVKVRHYQPDAPVLNLQVLFAHGGGWYLGGLDSHDSFCAHLAHDCGVTVTAIDYSLAPELPYPEGLNDIERVYRSLSMNNSSSILLMGDSAGGNLMAALSLRCRRKGISPAYAQCLLYPALSKIGSLPSHLAMSDAPLLDTSSIDYCWGQYVSLYEYSNAEIEELLPLSASTHISLPPTMLFAAEYDPLIDDARYYQQALIAAKVPAELSVIRGLVHSGLHGFKSTSEGRQFYAEINSYVQSQIKKLAG